MPPSAIQPCPTVITTTPPSPPGSLDDIQAELDLTRAYIQSAEMGTVTPLLKQELRYKIQTRRLSEGRTELPTSETKHKPVDKLTVEDIRKRTVRRKQNKESSKRIRQREIAREDELRKRINILSADNTRLRRTRNALRIEKEHILKRLQNISTDIEKTPASPNKGITLLSPASPNKGITSLSPASPNKGITSLSPASPNKGITLLSPASPNKGITLLSPASPNKGITLLSPASPNRGITSLSPASPNKGITSLSPASPNKGITLLSPASPNKGITSLSPASPNKGITSLSPASPNKGPSVYLIALTMS